MSKQVPVKDPPNRVHLEKIWAETIKKETVAAEGYLYDNYFISPFELKKLAGATDKPNTTYGVDKIQKPEIELQAEEKEPEKPKEQDQDQDRAKSMNSEYSTGSKDSYFFSVFDSTQKRPKDKYKFSQTGNMDYGWYDDDKIVQQDRHDRRINAFRVNSEITKYMESAWRVAEQSKINSG